MYRSRLKGSLDKDILQYISSIEDDKVLLKYDVIGSIAHVLMLMETRIISKESTKEILKALLKAFNDNIPTDGFEDIHEALEAYVISIASIEHGGRMHTARSRNDQVVLDLRLMVRDEINIISKQLIELIDKLLIKATDNLDCIMLMYTHLQHAQIGSFSHYLLSYVDSFFRDLERLKDCYKRVNRSPLGASAGGGTSLPIDRNLTSNLLAFDSLIENSLDSTSNRDFLLEFAFVLTNVMINLSRMAEDLIIWSSTEFNYVELPDELSSSSSLMPHKKNPCPLELVRSKASSVIGDLIALLTTIKSLPSGYNRDLQDTKRIIIRAIKLTKDSINVISKVIEGLIVKRDNMLTKANNSYALAIDVAELLVKEGIAFREAHRIIGNLVGLASKKGIPLKGLSPEEVNNAKLYLIIKEIDAKKAIEMRNSIGSPNPKEVIRMINDRLALSSRYKREIDEKIKSIEDATNRLKAKASEIIQDP